MVKAPIIHGDVIRACRHAVGMHQAVHYHVTQRRARVLEVYHRLGWATW